MEQAEAQVGEHFAGQALVFGGGGADIYLVRFLHQGVDDEGLAAGGGLLAEEAVGVAAAVFGHDAGHYFLAAGREFVDGGDIQVAVQGQL